MATWQEWSAQNPTLAQFTLKDPNQGLAQIAKAIGYGGPVFDRGSTMSQAEGDSGASVVQDTYSPNAGLLQALQAYQFDNGNVGKHPGVSVSGPNGAVGNFRMGDAGSRFDDFAYKAIPIGVGLLGGAALGGFIPGAEIGAASSAGGGAIAGGGAGELAAYGASLTPAEAAASAGALDLGGAAAGAADAISMVGGGELAAYGGMPELAAMGAGAPTETAFGSFGLGGGGGGGLLGNVGSGIAAWAKENPLLARLGVSAGTGLLSAAGGSGGSSAADQTDYGPAKQWTSPIQGGILNPVQQLQPQAIRQPQGLLAQGQANDGAWRWMRG